LNLKIDSESFAELLKRDPSLLFKYDNDLKVFSYLRGNLYKVTNKTTEDLFSTCIRFVNQHQDLFGNINTNGLTILQNTSDPNGGLSITLQQHHGSNKVYDGSIRFHMNGRGILDSINNGLFPDLKDVPKEPTITREEAIELLKEKIGIEDFHSTNAELVVYRHNGKPYLTWQVQIKESKVKRKEVQNISWLAGEHGGPSEWIGYVDAVNGNILLYYDNLKTLGPVIGSGMGYYSGHINNLFTWYNDVVYQLRDTSRKPSGGPEIITIDEDGSYPSEDVDNNWNDLITQPRDQNQGAEVDAHNYSGYAITYFKIVHGRNSFDGNGRDLPIVVHYDNNWDNAGWESSGRLILGDGSGVIPGFDYLCSDDVLIHEFTHAVTQFTCNLEYRSEPGALNESFSDIFAAFATRWINPDPTNWLIGERCWLKQTAPALRNIRDPTNGGQWSAPDWRNSVSNGHQPSHYSVRFQGPEDNQGVHINSGIINHLVYLLTEGGTHSSTRITIEGIGQSSVEQMVYRCMTVNLVGKPRSYFIDFRQAMLDACLDLFPKDLHKLTQVKKAFDAVGLWYDIRARDFLTDQGEEPYTGDRAWESPDIINRHSISLNPTQEFGDLSDGTLSQDIKYGQDNFVYIRILPRVFFPTDVTINVYLAEASTFPTPSSWIHIGTFFESQVRTTRVIVSGPLTISASSIPSPGHYCFIAVISSPMDPAPDINLVTSSEEFGYFVKSTNNIVWRNTTIVNLIPESSNEISVKVKSFNNNYEKYDLVIDNDAFVPNSKILVKGSSNILGASIPIGLRLISRKEGYDVYEVNNIQNNKYTLSYDKKGQSTNESNFKVYFKDLLVENEFDLKITYRLPATIIADSVPENGFLLSIRQLRNGINIGAFGIRVVKSN
jgi:bacillolysin